MAFGKRVLPIPSRLKENEVVTVICIFTLNTLAGFTCCIYSAKVTRPTYHPIKRVSLAH